MLKAPSVLSRIKGFVMGIKRILIILILFSLVFSGGELYGKHVSERSPINGLPSAVNAHNLSIYMYAKKHHGIGHRKP